MSSGADAQPRPPNPRPSPLRSRSPVWAAALLSLVLTAIWARYLAGVGGDLAAQWSWADFAAKYPGSAYDLAWYGGIHPASYSLLAPFLMAALGVPAAGVLSVIVSAVLLAHLLTSAGLRWPLPVALWGAFALWCDLAAGRVTFAIGLTFGLAAIAPPGAPRPGLGPHRTRRRPARSSPSAPARSPACSSRSPPRPCCSPDASAQASPSASPDRSWSC